MKVLNVLGVAIAQDKCLGDSNYVLINAITIFLKQLFMNVHL